MKKETRKRKMVRWVNEKKCRIFEFITLHNQGNIFIKITHQWIILKVDVMNGQIERSGDQCIDDGD